MVHSPALLKDAASLPLWHDRHVPAAPVRQRVAAPRVAFLFNAQAHQILHGITTAEALAEQWHTQVDILAPSTAHLDLARAMVQPGEESRLRFRTIGSPFLNRMAQSHNRAVPPKLLTLLHARRLLDSYDALALPERTSTILRYLGVRRPKLIHIDHGAGDRAAGYDRRIAQFDFALLAGRKQERRMLEEGLIRPNAYQIVGYPKFDAVERLHRRACVTFAHKRPIVLYNPHFSKKLGSWSRHGLDIVERIASDGRFNLIVAPHVRMCDAPARRAAMEKLIGHLAAFPHVHVDLGSERSIDMSYVTMADIYLGDVSSQIYEFLNRPRPAIFINSHNADWRDNPDYAHWRFGPVAETPAEVMAMLLRASDDHVRYIDEQRRAFRDTFDLREDESHSSRAAAAIAGFLRLDAR